MTTKFLFILLVLTLAELGKADSLLFLEEDKHFHNDEKSTNLQSLLDAESKIE